MEPTTLLTNPVKHALNGKHKQGNVVRKARKYVFALYNEHASSDRYYHTYTRAFEVVRACKELARALDLTDDDSEVLFLAAWFVDSRYVGSDQEPKPASVDRARTFLEAYGYPAAKTGQVLACIQSVEGNQPTQSPLAEILNDGYWLYLADKDYIRQAELIRAEREWFSGRTFSDEEWIIQCLDDFTQQPFYTEFAQREFSRQRAENRLALTHKLRKLTHSAKADHKSGDENKLSFHEIEDAFRLTSRNYVNLVGVADRKAGLLIHVSSIIISIVLAVLLRHLVDHPVLLGPTVLLLIVCSITIAFAILASRPTHVADIPGVQTDGPILFFGSFDKTDPVFEHVSWETYGSQIKQLIGNRKELLFTQITGELYQTRKLLSPKFRYLSYAYLTFLIGMVVTVMTYIIAAFIQNPTT
jgi:predicted metal-dependent HD superfamily phosphohydrolase